MSEKGGLIEPPRKISMSSDENLYGPILAHADFALVSQHHRKNELQSINMKSSDVSSRGLRSALCNKSTAIDSNDCDAEIAAPATGYYHAPGQMAAPTKECGWKRDGRDSLE